MDGGPPSRRQPAPQPVKPTHVLPVLGLCAAGFVCGYAGNRLSSEKPADPATARPAAGNPVSRPGGETTGDAAAVRGRAAAKTPRPAAKSTDTLESLAALDDKSLYARLALWLVDASEQDIAAWWQSYRQKGKRSNDINDLIFIHWARVNPQGAIAAATGTPDEHYAWWAWSCHDPKAALAAAIAKNADRVNNVTWGIGEFHPEWLREHFDEIPESGRDNAFRGLEKWDDHPDPLEILKFLREKGRGFSADLFQTLARRDPWAAYDWIQEHGATQSSNYGGRYDVLETFIKSVGESNPEVLQRIAEQAPSGELKRKLEAAFFENLVKSDPEEAMKQALETKAPLIASERIAGVGLGLVSTDPDKAFEMAEKMFEKCPDALNRMTTIRYPNGSSGYGESNALPDQLMAGLLAKDPERVMAMCRTGNKPSPAFSQVARNWAERDMEGYAHWVNRQTDPELREPAAVTLVNQLQSQQQFGEAADWVMSLRNSRQDYLENLINNWSRRNPEEAREWLDAADLTDHEKQQIGRNIQNP